jgi:uncharacterized sporulation protein YeaH/YhbH (DUF444 family)
MGLREDVERFREVGEQRRQDLAEFITYGDLGGGDIHIPIKIVDLPEFCYDRRDRGGVAQAPDGTPEPGDPVPVPVDGEDGDGEGEDPGEGHDEHEYYEMDPEEFAAELDEALGLDLDPKGKAVVEEAEGDYTDVARTGPTSTLDLERLFKAGLRRKLAMDFDEEYVTEALKVAGWGPRDAFEWARQRHVNVSLSWLADRYDDLDSAERETWPDIEAMEDAVDRTPTHVRVRREGVREIPFRPEDERFRYPEVVTEPERNVVVVNIRDVSGSMRERKRDLVERTFTPLDWYLTGKYDNAVFLYIAHDATAWEVERAEFFGIRSGGGTRISTAYELAAERLEEYPFSEWNRYVFAAGDGENPRQDTRDAVIPLIEDIDANLHAYVEAGDGGGRHGQAVEEAFADAGDVVVTRVTDRTDVLDAIYDILSTESDDTN